MKLGYWPKLKGIKCSETEEKAKQVYDVLMNFIKFCKKYKLEEDEINFIFYIYYQMMNYRISVSKDKEEK